MKNAKSTIARNLEALMRKAGTNPHELQRATGVPQPTIHRILTGESRDPRYQTLEPLADFFKVTPAALRDSYFSVDEVEEEYERNRALRRSLEAEDSDPSLTHIPKVKLRLSAGTRSFDMEKDEYDGANTTVPTGWLDRNKLQRSHLIAIRVQGESMEPTLFPDDLVIVNVEDRQIVDGAVYAINYEGEMVVKRLERDAGEWWLKSDNPDQRKYSRKVFRDDVSFIIGRVIRKESAHV